MMVLRRGNAVLLQKRPPKAIWGGLWSLPESPWRAKGLNEVGSFQMTGKALLALTLPEEDHLTIGRHCKINIQGERIKHVFTHRRLWMQIWHVSANQALEFSSENLRWVSLKQLGKYGLPQPIKLLLQGLSLAHGDD
jgi:A/G-specific adenine glycosylase